MSGSRLVIFFLIVTLRCSGGTPYTSPITTTEHTFPPPSGPRTPAGAPAQPFTVASYPGSSQVDSHSISSGARPQRYIIRTDVSYDRHHNMLTAVMELPGVKKGSSDLSVVLSTCIFNRVKQVTVSGIVRPVAPTFAGAVFTGSGSASATTTAAAGAGSGSAAASASAAPASAAGASGSSGGGGAGSSALQTVAGAAGGSEEASAAQLNVRERKYGEFTRTFAVPSETKVRHNSSSFLPFLSCFSSLSFVSFSSLVSRFFIFSSLFSFARPDGPNSTVSLIFSFLSDQPEDLDALLEDGLLILQIRCGKPAESDDRQVISVR